jgi:hypothetical protein
MPVGVSHSDAGADDAGRLLAFGDAPEAWTAARWFYLVVVADDGDVMAVEVEPVDVITRGPMGLENQGDDAVSMWESARDALASIMPDDDLEDVA